jgi:hypothetical protein
MKGRKEEWKEGEGKGTRKAEQVTEAWRGRTSLHQKLHLHHSTLLLGACGQHLLSSIPSAH